MALITEALARLWPRRVAELQPKGSATGALVAWEPLGAPVWTPRDYQAFAREGFMQNAIVYRSVRMIAEAAATIPLLLYERDAEVSEHPLLELLRRPSADHTQTDFLEAWYGFLLVAGNAYAEAVAIGGRLRELHVLRPDRMKVIPGGDGWPEAYEYTAGGHSVRFTGEAVEGVRPILHVRLFHPANDHYGMSPIEAAAGAIDTHNTAARWNKALLDNSARPSGALVYTARDGQLTGEQYERLKGELEAGFQGARHAGRPLLLEGGLDWKPLSLSPKDMDFVEAKHAAAREIALALGVPPMLLGIPGDNTYSNYQEATRSFWRQTVLPLVNRTTKALSAWLAPAYGGGLELRPDLDQVEALAGEREALWKRLEQANFLTVNEKRAAIGYGPLAGGGGEGEAGRKFNPYHDELGRFTTAEGAVAPGEKPVVLAQAEGSRQYSVDLVDEEALGGHTIRRHVGKSDEELLNILRAAQFDGLFIRAAKEREGSFASREAANDFVNQALRANQETVESVASGAQPEAWLKHRFGAPTGKEAFRADAYAEPYMRTTYSVGVLIRHDPRSKRGYTVRTAYPLNEPPGEK